MMQLTSERIGWLQGNATMVLAILMIERGPRDLDFLMAMTSMSDKTLHQAMQKLKIAMLVSETRASGGKFVYQVAAGVKQLPLMAEELPEEVEAATDVIDLEMMAVETDRNFSDSPLNESMNQGSIDSIEDDSLFDGGAGPEIPELATAKGLLGLGFYGKGIADMLRIQGLTMDEVRYQVEHSPNLGCALARIRKRQAWGTWERDGPGERSEYIGGSYADFIQH